MLIVAHDRQLDDDQVGLRAGMVEQCLQESPPDPAAANLGRDVHSPQRRSMRPLATQLPAQANVSAKRRLECTEHDIAWCSRFTGQHAFHFREWMRAPFMRSCLRIVELDEHVSEIFGELDHIRGQGTKRHGIWARVSVGSASLARL
jgi:hypothetical protein